MRSPELPWETKRKHIEEYSLRLQFSGYNEKIRKDIVKSAITAYERIQKSVKKGERPLYRTKLWKKKERAKGKRMKKSNWYKKKESKKRNKNDVYKSLIFVQPTKGSVLKKKYEEVIGKSKCEVRVVERAGRNISQKLQKSYPFNKDKCNSQECFVCVSGGKGNCRKENINYEIECIREGCKYIYLGESARNSWCRGREHLRGIDKREKDSVFVEHINEKHDGDFAYDRCGGFRMNVKESHKTALDRQITEAVKIETCEKQILNRRTGYRANTVLRLSSTLSGSCDTAARL